MLVLRMRRQTNTGTSTGGEQGRIKIGPPQLIEDWRRLVGFYSLLEYRASFFSSFPFVPIELVTWKSWCACRDVKILQKWNRYAPLQNQSFSNLFTKQIHKSLNNYKNLTVFQKGLQSDVVKLGPNAFKSTLDHIFKPSSAVFFQFSQYGSKTCAFSIADPPNLLFGSTGKVHVQQGSDV